MPSVRPTVTTVLDERTVSHVDPSNKSTSASSRLDTATLPVDEISANKSVWSVGHKMFSCHCPLGKMHLLMVIRQCFREGGQPQ